MAACTFPTSALSARSCIRAMAPVRVIARVAPRRVRVMAAPVAELQATQKRINQHPDPDFIKETLEAFPAEGVANHEQALVSEQAVCGILEGFSLDLDTGTKFRHYRYREGPPSAGTDIIQKAARKHASQCTVYNNLTSCTHSSIITLPSMQVLFLEGGYKFLDVRSDREHGFGAIRGSIHVPYTKDKKTWADGKMLIEKTKVDGWIKNVNAKIPKKDTKLIVHDMMGKQVITVRHDMHITESTDIHIPVLLFDMICTSRSLPVYGNYHMVTSKLMVLVVASMSPGY